MEGCTITEHCPLALKQEQHIFRCPLSTPAEIYIFGEVSKLLLPLNKDSWLFCFLSLSFNTPFSLPYLQKIFTLLGN